MSEFAATLWDLLGLGKSPWRQEPTARAGPAEPRRGGQLTMRERYDDLVREMKRVHGVRVRRWRTSTSGVAWIVRYQDGTESRLIESPYPRGPVSCAIFLHEIGHHAIGFRRYRPRCLEEYRAWKWALDVMRAKGFDVTEAVQRRVSESLRYAVRKARQRGLKRLPVELVPYR